MIKVTRLDSSQLVVNCDLIEFVESTPDTMISLLTGKKIMVSEDIDTVIDRVAEFKRKAGNPVYRPDSTAHKVGD